MRAALDGEVRARFEEEFAAALAQTAQDFDVERLQVVVRRWWPQAWACANPDPALDQEIEQWRDRGEDFSEFTPASALGEDGDRTEV